MEGHDTVARLLGLGVVASVISFTGVVFLSRWARALGLVDVPNRRSSHVQPTPRGGGFPLMLTVLIGMFGLNIAGWIVVPPAVTALCAGALVVAAVSFADDLWRLPPAVRIAAHVAGTLVLVAGGGVLDSVQLSDGRALSTGWMSLPLTFLWVIGLTNAYNFMDGIDGLAAAQAIVTALAMGWLAHLLGNRLVVVFMLLLASATLGFLVLNWPPAKVFLGDVGSAFLGFTFAGWAVLSGNSHGGGPPFLAWAAVLSPFLLDTAITLACRIARREPWYEAHREHFYQRLVLRGWGHGSVTGLYVAMAGLSGAASVLCYGYHRVPGVVVLSITVLVFGLLILLVRAVERRTAPASARD